MKGASTAIAIQKYRERREKNSLSDKKMASKLERQFSGEEQYFTELERKRTILAGK